MKRKLVTAFFVGTISLSMIVPSTVVFAEAADTAEESAAEESSEAPAEEAADTSAAEELADSTEELKTIGTVDEDAYQIHLKNSTGKAIIALYVADVESEYYLETAELLNPISDEEADSETLDSEEAAEGTAEAIAEADSEATTEDTAEEEISLDDIVIDMAEFEDLDVFEADDERILYFNPEILIEETEEAEDAEEAQAEETTAEDTTAEDTTEAAESTDTKEASADGTAPAVYDILLCFDDDTVAELHDVPFYDMEKAELKMEEGVAYLVYESVAEKTEVNTLEAEKVIAQEAAEAEALYEEEDYDDVGYLYDEDYNDDDYYDDDDYYYDDDEDYYDDDDDYYDDDDYDYDDDDGGDECLDDGLMF